MFDIHISNLKVYKKISEKNLCLSNSNIFNIYLKDKNIYICTILNYSDYINNVGNTDCAIYVL